MRTLAQILSAAKVGGPTTHAECLYALLAMDGLTTFDHQDLMAMAVEFRDGKPNKLITPESRWGESFRRWKTALGRSPRDWLGPNNDPANPEVAARVRAARRLVDKIAEDPAATIRAHGMGK